jgi:mono/diheme cytochrome c family protein
MTLGRRINGSCAADAFPGFRRKAGIGRPGSSGRRFLYAAVAALAMSAPMASGAAGDKARGEELFLRYCQGCHGPDGRGGGKAFMPHVGPLARKGYIDLMEDSDLAHVIKEGGQAVGKSSYMPSWKSTLSDQDIADIIAFIRTFTID